MNKQRLQQLAGITQLNEITIQPNTKLFSWVSDTEISYDKEDLITVYFDDDEIISFSSGLDDVGYDEEDILEQNESLEQNMSYLEDNGYENASSTIKSYINFKRDLDKFNIFHEISYFGDGGSIYINLSIKYNDIKNKVFWSQKFS